MSIICSAILPESPRLLVELGRLEEAKRSFSWIAKLNGKKFEWNESEFTRGKKTDLQQTASTITAQTLEENKFQTKKAPSACYFMK